MPCGMPAAFLEQLPGFSTVNAYCQCQYTRSVDSQLGGVRGSADSGARLGLTGPSQKMQGRVVDEYRYWNSQ